MVIEYIVKLSCVNSIFLANYTSKKTLWDNGGMAAAEIKAVWAEWAVQILLQVNDDLTKKMRQFILLPQTAISPNYLNLPKPAKSAGQKYTSMNTRYEGVFK